MKHIKEWNWKQIGWRVLQGIIMFILNGASFAWLILHFIPLEIPNFGEITYWDILSSKALYQIILDKFDNISWLPEYHFYNTMLVYLFMLLGAIATIFFIKLLWKNKQNKKDRELAEKEYELKKKDIEEKEKQNKAINKMIERLSKDR